MTVGMVAREPRAPSHSKQHNRASFRHGRAKHAVKRRALDNVGYEARRTHAQENVSMTYALACGDTDCDHHTSRALRAYQACYPHALQKKKIMSGDKLTELSTYLRLW